MRWPVVVAKTAFLDYNSVDLWNVLLFLLVTMIRSNRCLHTYSMLYRSSNGRAWHRIIEVSLKLPLYHFEITLCSQKLCVFVGSFFFFLSVDWPEGQLTCSTDSTVTVPEHIHLLSYIAYLQLFCVLSSLPESHYARFLLFISKLVRSKYCGKCLCVCVEF